MNAPEPQAAPAADGAWARFREHHLFDYTPAATRWWLGIAATGAAAMLWAVAALATQPVLQLWPVAVGLALVALAALFPVQLPRTHYTVLVADVFIYTMLATLGAPAAMLAAGLEGLIGALRSSKRLTTHVSAPAANIAAMGACGVAYLGLCQLLKSLGVSHEIATLAAMCLASPLPVALTTGSLMALMSAKRGQRLAFSDWFSATTWIAAMSLGAAFVAGLVHLNAQRFGPGVIVIAAALVADAGRAAAADAAAP